VDPDSQSLSFQLELPVHTFLPTGASVAVRVAVDHAGRRLFVSGVYKPLFEGEPWQWGVTIVNLDTFSVDAVVDVAPVKRSSTTVNSIQHIELGTCVCLVVRVCAESGCRKHSTLFPSLPFPVVHDLALMNFRLHALIYSFHLGAGRKQLYVFISICPSNKSPGDFCTSQAEDRVTIVSYALEQFDSQHVSPRVHTDTESLLPRHIRLGAVRSMRQPTPSSARALVSPEPSVGGVDCPGSYPDFTVWFDYDDEFIYMRCTGSESKYQLQRLHLDDFAADGVTCTPYLPSGFGSMYSSIMTAGVVYLGVTSASAKNYVAQLRVRDLQFSTSCSHFYQQWWFFVSVIGGVLVLAACVTTCIACRRRRVRALVEKSMAAQESAAAEGGYLPPLLASPALARTPRQFRAAPRRHR